MNIQRNTPADSQTQQHGTKRARSWRFLTGRTLPILISLLLAAVMALGSAADARGGGGQSFSSGSHGGGNGGGGALVWFLFQLVFRYPIIGIPLLLIVIGYFIYASRKSTSTGSSSDAATGFSGSPAAGAPAVSLSGPLASNVQAGFAALRKYDENFSEIAFTDFCYALYGRTHEARGHGDLTGLTSYLSPEVIAGLQPTPPAIRQVTGVIVGASTITQVSDPDAAPQVTIVVNFQANYTEVDRAGHSQSYYVQEDWSFIRNRDVVSPEPEKITALHCPRCGGALDMKPDGSCAYCGVKITGGNFAWFVNRIAVREREGQGPLLTSNVPEEGTDFPTIYQPNLAAVEAQFASLNPDFNWQRTEARMKDIFMAIQDAWSTLHWTKARPYETDNVFQMHQYWIDSYQKQGLRNALENVAIESVIPAKFGSDKFYDAITTRIFAHMIDFTEDAAGKLVCGSKNKPRRFSEYWTFIRRRGAQENKHGSELCPNCGAPLKINMAGTCEFCGGKVSSGTFDWVLSRIEQDETYEG
ncbi:MAG: TIM44-like domain-containing protein [Armatimonadota bacterium]|nr:TIM44-like domain-containing protein [Armatimonadota bacterium]